MSTPPTISIDRASRSFAIFDESDTIIGGFQPYMNEQTALESGRAQLMALTGKEPRVVYPQITSMRMSMSTRRVRR